VNFIVRVNSNNDTCETPRALVRLLRLATNLIEDHQRKLPWMKRGPVHSVVENGPTLGSYQIIPIDVTAESILTLPANICDLAEKVAHGSLRGDAAFVAARQVCEAVAEKRWLG